MFPRALRVATIGGVDVRVDPSWLLIAVAIVFSYHRSFTADGRSLATSVTMAVVASLLFSASVLIHELAHALEGTHRGAEVEGITLFLLGGVTALHSEDRRARDEFAIAAIGPWSNVVLAAAFGLLATTADRYGATIVADVAGLLGWLNIGLAVFNLIPGAPLDGGRVLRAGIWALTGDRHRATTAAAWFGLTISAVMLLGAGWLLLTAPGGIVSALWIGAIAAYMVVAARGELVRGRLARWLARFPAATMAPAAPRADHAVLAGALLQDPTVPRAWLLVDERRPVAVVTRAALLEVSPTSAASSVSTSLDTLPRLAQDATADGLVNLLDRDQPYVLLGDDDDTWLSSLDVIDHAIRDARAARATAGAT